MSKTYSKTRILVECALMIAIGTVLSNIKIFTMPNGGHSPSPVRVRGAQGCTSCT